jgi:hypothetical protein
MTKKKIQLVVLIILALAAAILISKQNNSSIKTSYQNFSVADTAAIDQLIISRINHEKVILTRQNNMWMVNGKYEAHKVLIVLALTTLHDIRVKEPVPKSDCDTIYRKIMEESSKVDIFKKNKIFKTIFIGSPTIDSLGTYAKIKNSPSPFITEIAGFRGFLSNRFPCSELEWRTRSLLRVQARNISMISLINNQNLNESFTIFQNKGEITIFNKTKEKISNISKEKLQNYLHEFDHKNFLSIAANLHKNKKDSIVNLGAKYIITIKQTNGVVQTIKIYNKPLTNRTDFFGKHLSVDPDVFYLETETGDFLTARFIAFNDILIGLSYLKNE